MKALLSWGGRRNHVGSLERVFNGMTCTGTKMARASKVRQGSENAFSETHAARFPATKSSRLREDL
jgi:hypothetical protein